MKLQHKGLKIFALTLFALVCVGIFVYLFGAAGGKSPFAKPYRVTATVANAFQLVPNADIRQAGVKIGAVETVDYDDRNRGLVKMAIKKQYAPIYADATIQVRTKTLVGENYIDIEPGTPAAGRVPTGATLDLSHDDASTQLDEILASLDPSTRASVKVNLRTLGVGLNGRGADLSRLFGATHPVVTDGEDVMSVLAGQRQAVARLVGNTGEVMDAFGRRASDVQMLARSAKATAVAAASRDAAMQDAIRALPGTLRQARETTLHLGTFARASTPVFHDLRLASRDLGPVVRDLQPTAVSGRALFAELPGFVRTVDPLLSSLRRFTSAARPMVPPLDRLLRHVNPALGYIARFHKDVGAFFGTVGSVNDTRDAVGQIGRVFMIYDESSAGALQPDAKKALDLLLDAGFVKAFHGIGTNSFPAPGTVGDPQPFDGSYPRLRSSK